MVWKGQRLLIFLLSGESPYVLVNELESVNDQDDDNHAGVNLTQDPLLFLFGVRLIFPMEDLERLIAIVYLVVKMDSIIRRLNLLEFDDRLDIFASRFCHCDEVWKDVKERGLGEI